MIKPVLKSLSFVFVAFGAVTASAEQAPALSLASMPRAMVASCPAQIDVERGWEAQQRLLDERLAAKGPAVTIPGTIVSPPLPDFGSERTAQAAQAKGSLSGRPAPKSEPTRGDRM